MGLKIFNFKKFLNFTFYLPQVTVFSATHTAAAETNHTYTKRNEITKANRKMVKKVLYILYSTSSFVNNFSSSIT